MSTGSSAAIRLRCAQLPSLHKGGCADRATPLRGRSHAGRASSMQRRLVLAASLAVEKAGGRVPALRKLRRERIDQVVNSRPQHSRSAPAVARSSDPRPVLPFLIPRGIRSGTVGYRPILNHSSTVVTNMTLAQLSRFAWWPLLARSRRSSPGRVAGSAHPRYCARATSATWRRVFLGRSQAPATRRATMGHRAFG